jgi:hypothetical protein
MTRAEKTTATAPHRQPVPTLIALSNATRPRRPPGARTAITFDPFGSYADAVALLEPLGLEQRLGTDELGDLRALAAETRAITEALLSNRRAPSIAALNRLARQATATQTLRTRARWHIDSGRPLARGHRGGRAGLPDRGRARPSRSGPAA